MSKAGREVSTVLAFSRWLLRMLAKEQPKAIAACFDESLGSCFRNDIYADYKSNRTLPDEDLAYELLACKKVCELLGVPVLASNKFEADDLIGSLAKHASAAGHNVFILSRDKDLGQLLSLENTFMWDLGFDDPIADASFTNEFGIAPERMAEYLAIVGDTSDAIPGVKGVGKKTVVGLFNHFDSWEQIKAAPHTIEQLPIRGAKRIAGLIAEGVDTVDRNLRLTQLALDCVNDSDFDVQRKIIQKDVLVDLYTEFRAPDSIIKLIEKV